MTRHSNGFGIIDKLKIVSWSVGSFESSRVFCELSYSSLSDVSHDWLLL